MFGREYVVDHCVLTYKQKIRKEAFEVYVTDALHILAESVSKIRGGRYLPTRFKDLFDVTPKEEGEERTAEDIINRIKQGLSK